MFRRFFRIGFGGCGCALEEHFRDHAAELSYNLLRNFYLEKLKNWTGKLPSEPFETTRVGTISDLIISPEKGKEGGNYAGKFFENLNKIIAELDSWKGSLGGAKGTGMSYEDAIIGVLIQNVTKMKDEAESIDKRGSVLLESLPVDSFTETQAKEKSKRFYVYNQYLTETRELIVDQFGQVVIESQGFNHQPELQMLPFSIKEVRDEVFKKITGTIETRRLKDSATGGYLFFVGLGGGTGTGVISPLAEKFGKGSLGYFAVAVLGGKEDDKVLESQQGWFRRCFNMLIALNDLIVTAELDGIILVDNDVIMTPEEKQKIGKSGPDLMAEIDKKIIEKLYPAFGITVLDGNDLDWSQLKEPIGLHTLKKKPPVIVPCYASEYCSKSEDNLKKLIDKALKDKVSGGNNGKLAPCEDLEKAERVFVYVRCITDEKKVRDALAQVFKVNEEDKYKKIAILKDYLFCWDDVKEGNDKELKSSLENVCEIDWVDKISMPDDKTIAISKNEKEVATITLNEEENKATLEWYNKKVEDPELNVETVKGKRHIYLKKCQATRTWIKNNLKKRIVVFESQEIGSFWHEDKKTNEVLILLFNPNVKKALRNRLLEAKNFVDLLDAFKDEIEEQAEKSSEDKSKIANNIVNGPKLSEILNKFSKATKDITEEDKKPLPQAKDFLFPKELYDKDKGIYDDMGKILDRLKSEVRRIPEGEDGDWWPIFRENIFNIISTSGKRDEVILSAIEALGKNTQNKFNRLVGEGVYNTYFETFKRQYFKYYARYLYPRVGEPILSDAAEKELPVALKEKLDKKKKRIEGGKLRKWVKMYTSVMNGHAGTTDGTELSYPAMLAIAGLYAEWEQVGSLPYDKVGKDAICQKLFGSGLSPADFEIYELPKESESKIDIPNNLNILIIDADEEDATLVIREADKDLLPGLTKEEIPSTDKEIPPELLDMFKKSGIEQVNNANYKVKDRKLLPRPEAIKDKKLYRCYCIKQNAGKYSINGDKIHNKLKVKKEEGEDGKTLKIYKKRGDVFIPAKADGEAKIECE